VEGSIAIVVLTHNRAELLRKCVENVLQKTSAATAEIVIWDNASSDHTAAYLDSLDDPRIRVIHSDANVGQNGYARSFRETSAPYLIELDDDVTNAPAGWDAQLLEAFERLPEVGFLAADPRTIPTTRPRSGATTAARTSTRRSPTTECACSSGQPAAAAR
jgi:GT2 family glycosyltransferase